jgi:hypothetical protein
MIEETELQKLKEDYPDFFRKTPPEVIDFALSEKTSEKIADIAVKNGVADEEKVERIAQRITLVLLNKLPSGNLAMTLELGVKLTPEIAKKVADEANQFISSAMVQLRSGGAVSPERTPSTPSPARTSISEEQKPKRPSSKDVYREKIE